jgi:hypothetical protein
LCGGDETLLVKIKKFHHRRRGGGRGGGIRVEGERWQVHVCYLKEESGVQSSRPPSAVPNNNDEGGSMYCGARVVCREFGINQEQQVIEEDMRCILARNNNTAVIILSTSFHQALLFL